MTFREDIENGVDGVLTPAWSTRDGTVVPKSGDIVLQDGAVNIDATYVYADLANSSALGQKVANKVAAKVVRAYLNAASRILRNFGGHIRSFDGDRVMAIFIGETKNTDAVRAALTLNWAVHNVLTPKFAARWETLADLWTTAHGIGIDTGKAMLVRGGVRDNNDLISIGSAPNVAAKLSELRCANIHITKAVYSKMLDSSRLANGQDMWSTHGLVRVADKEHSVYWSNWTWAA